MPSRRGWRCGDCVPARVVVKINQRRRRLSVSKGGVFGRWMCLEGSACAWSGERRERWTEVSTPRIELVPHEILIQQSISAITSLHRRISSQAHSAQSIQQSSLLFNMAPTLSSHAPSTCALSALSSALSSLRLSSLSSIRHASHQAQASPPNPPNPLNFSNRMTGSRKRSQRWSRKTSGSEENRGRIRSPRQHSL